MDHIIVALLCGLALTLGQQTHAAESWIEGTHYSRIIRAQPTSVPAGKVEVMEVFSYGCIVCNAYQPLVQKLEKALPAARPGDAGTRHAMLRREREVQGEPGCATER